MAKKKPKPERRRIPLNKIRKGPVRGELEEGDAVAVRYIHQYSFLLTGKSLEETELDFMRDADPSREIAIWMNMIGASRRFCKLNPTADLKAVLKSLLHVSLGVEPPLKEVAAFAKTFACDQSIDYFDQWLDAQDG